MTKGYWCHMRPGPSAAISLLSKHRSSRCCLNQTWRMPSKFRIVFICPFVQIQANFIETNSASDVLSARLLAASDACRASRQKPQTGHMPSVRLKHAKRVFQILIATNTHITGMCLADVKHGSILKWLFIPCPGYLVNYLLRKEVVNKTIHHDLIIGEL